MSRKPIRQWLEQLEEPYKTQALTNTINQGRSSLDETAGSMSGAINLSMDWSTTPQGHSYWQTIHDYFDERNRDSFVVPDFIKEKMEAYRIQFEEINMHRELKKVHISSSMKDMLNKIANDSRVALYMLDSDAITNEFCNYITTRGTMLSYLPNGREHKINLENGRWLRDGRQEMKPAKLARKLFIQKYLDAFTDADFETFGNKVRAYLGIVGDEDGEGRNITLDVISGSKIRDAYHHSSYSYALGDGTNLHGSCMRSGDAQDYFGIYEKNEDVVQMLVAKDTEGKILGRALLWTFDNGDKGMDTVYGPNIIEQVMKEWAIDNGYYYKSSQSCHHHTFDKFKGASLTTDEYRDKEHRRVIIKEWDFDYYPYVDSLYLMGRDSGKYYLCNGHRSGLDLFRTLRCTNGRYEEEDDDDDDYVTLENGDICHQDDAYHLDYTAHDGDRVCGYYHESEVVYTMNGDHYLREHCTRISGDWYAKDDDEIAYVEDRDAYFLAENTVYCEVRELTIHIDDAVEVGDGDWCDKDEAFKCTYDDQWYFKSECVVAPDGMNVHENNLELYLEQIQKETNETERETTIA